MKNKLTKNIIERYSRQIVLKDIGISGQKEIINSKVLIVGAGGLGCPIADYLSRAGIGTLGIADYDKVSLSNIHPQSLFDSSDVGKFKVISQSSIASGIRRVEALRDKKLKDYESSLQKDKSVKQKILKDQIDVIRSELSKFKVKIDYNDNLELSENLKNLTKQLERIKIQNVIKDKRKNVIKDNNLGSFVFRQQVLTDFPPKELRSIIDQGKKDIKKASS